MAATIRNSEDRSERLRTLTEVSRALTLTVSIEEVLRITVERAAELMGADKALIMLADDEGLLMVRAAHGLDAERTKELREPLNETLVSRLQVLLDYQLDESFLSVPLVAQGEVTGLLAVVRAGGDPCTDDDEWLLSALADQTAVALDHAQLTETVRLERDARSRVVEAQERVHATLGHELRSPLTAIQSYSALLLDGLFGTLNDRQREGIARIRLSGEHLLAMMENLLDTARLGTGNIVLSSSDLDLGSVVNEAVQMLQPVLTNRRQELRMDCTEALLVRGDANRLRQALLNLIGNSIKYTPVGGSIQVGTSRRRWQGKEFAGVSVADDGAGIPPAMLARIFEPYVRGDAAQDLPGLGLGLFISRQLVRQMGGDIDVSSKVGAGSTFTVLVPLVNAGKGVAGADEPSAEDRA